MIIKILTILFYPPLKVVGYIIGFLTWPIVAGFVKGYSLSLGKALSEYEIEVKAHSIKEE